MVTVLLLPTAAPKNSLTVVEVIPTVLENSSLLIIIIKQYPETLQVSTMVKRSSSYRATVTEDRVEHLAEQSESLNFNILGMHVAYKGAL